MLLQMDIDLINTLAIPVREWELFGETTYNENNLKEAKLEVVRIVNRIKARYDGFDLDEKIMARDIMKKVKTYYNINYDEVLV